MGRDCLDEGIVRDEISYFGSNGMDTLIYFTPGPSHTSVSQTVVLARWNNPHSRCCPHTENKGM